MHNIPTLLFIIVLIISWKYEIVGAIVYILAGLSIIIVATISLIRDNESPLLAVINPISAVLFVIGSLFFLSWIIKRSSKSK